MPVYAKKLMPALQAATRHNIPAEEFAAAYDALVQAGYFSENMSAVDMIITVLSAAATARWSKAMKGKS